MYCTHNHIYENVSTRIWIFFIGELRPNLNEPCYDKVALLIGNKNYRQSTLKLNTPENDAQDLAGVLRSAGFKVVSLVNLNKMEMEKVSTSLSLLPPSLPSSLSPPSLSVMICTILSPSPPRLCSTLRLCLGRMSMLYSSLLVMALSTIRWTTWWLLMLMWRSVLTSVSVLRLCCTPCRREGPSYPLSSWTCAESMLQLRKRNSSACLIIHNIARDSDM